MTLPQKEVQIASIMKLNSRQWRSEGKCRSSPPQICVQEFKMNEDHVSYLLNVLGILEHLERQNQTLTNCKMGLVFILDYGSSLFATFLITTLPFFCLV